MTRCPRCRALGLSTDCYDQLILRAAERDAAVNSQPEYELDVTMRFTVPVSSTLPLDPHEMATHMREQWMTEETELQDVLLDVVNGDYDLQVAPVFGL